MNLIGHKETKGELKEAQDSAHKRNMALPHILFAGSAGCGKTSMAREIARTSEVPFISVSPDSLKGTREVTKCLDNLNHDNYDERGNKKGRIKPSIIFIDEIHKLTLPAQETLGIAMEDFMLETGRPNRFRWLPYFTLIGATTLAGNLSKPFHDRFKLRFVFRPYSLEESVDIVKMHAKRLQLMLMPEATAAIARRGRGVPRIIVGYIERIRDASFSREKPLVTEKFVNSVFNRIGIDGEGFTRAEIDILKALYDSDKPIGLDNIAILANETPKTVQHTIEPFLIQKGYMMRSGAGRIITRPGREYLDTQGHTSVVSGKIDIEAGYERS